MQGHIEDTGDCATCANEQTNATAYPCSDCATGELWEKDTSGYVMVTTESHGTARVPEDVA